MTSVARLIRRKATRVLTAASLATVASLSAITAAVQPAQAHNPACESSAFYSSPYAGYIQSIAIVKHCRTYTVSGVVYGKAAVEHTVTYSTGGQPVTAYYRYVVGDRHGASDTSYWLPCVAGRTYQTRVVAQYKHHGSWTNEATAYNYFYCV